MSLNYMFIVDLAGRYWPPPGRLLDFGCGAADVAALALDKGYDAYGVDTFGGIGARSDNLRIARAKIDERAIAVKPGAAMPFANGSFDIVVSNQVFEHVSALGEVLDEIARVTRPGGILFALMPTAEVLWEDHLKMPWVHRLPVGSDHQRRMMRALRRIGFGTDRHIPDDQWTNIAVNILRQKVFHRSVQEYLSTCGNNFRLLAEEEPAWARYRILRHRVLKRATGFLEHPAFDGVIRSTVRRAAGSVLVFERMED